MPFSAPHIRHLIRLTLGLTLAASVLGGCDALHPPAAVVNGTEISEEELVLTIPQYEFFGAVQQQGCAQPEPGERAASACARFTLIQLIEEELLRAYADEHGIVVRSTDVDETYGSLQDQVGPGLPSLFEESGVAEEDVRSLIERLLLSRRVEGALAARIVGEDALRRAYEERRLQFTNTIHAWHILVDDEPLADRIARQATAENFAALARKHSTDPGSARRGGDLGTVPASQFDATFAQAAIELEPGEISAPVQTQFGWHIIRLIEADVASFEEVREFLSREVAGQPLGDWLARELGRADIEVNPKYGRLDPAGRRIAPIRSTETGSPAPTGAATLPTQAPSPASS